MLVQSFALMTVITLAALLGRYRNAVVNGDIRAFANHSVKHCGERLSYYVPSLKLCITGFHSSAKKTSGPGKYIPKKGFKQANASCTKLYHGRLLDLYHRDAKVKLRVGAQIAHELANEARYIYGRFKSFQSLIGTRIARNGQVMSLNGTNLDEIADFLIEFDSKASKNCIPYCTVIYMIAEGEAHQWKTSGAHLNYPSYICEKNAYHA